MFFNVLQGAYAYVVVGLILVVSVLSLVLIGLIIERTKEMASLVTESAVPVPVRVEEPKALEELKTKLTALEAQNESLKKSEGEKTSLQEKVKYLESKLLEYEILQEEIGTLSTLKLENERLKSGLMQKGAPPKEPVVATASAITTVPEVVEEAKREPKIMETAEPPPQAPIVAPKVSALKDAPEKAAQDEIEDLLQQIDELTQGVRKSA